MIQKGLLRVHVVFAVLSVVLASLIDTPRLAAQEIGLFQITKHKGEDALNPDWSPVGDTIVFNTNRGSRNGRMRDVWSIAADGSSAQRLTVFPDDGYDRGVAAQYWIASTGDLAVYDANDIWEWLRFQLSKNPPLPVYRDVYDGPSTYFEELLIIPGGLGGDSWTVSQDGLSAGWSVRTTPNGVCPEQANAVVASFNTLDGQYANQVGNVIVSASLNCNVMDNPIQGMSFSPDGLQIVISRTPDPNYHGFDLEIWNTSGGFVRKLTNNGGGPNPVRNWHPRWSPDGTRIVFASDLVGQFQIFTINPDGTNLVQVTTGGGDWPTWSPDSSKIAFQSDRSGHWEIYSVFATSGFQIPFLNFPLQSRTATTAKIVTVFDHSSDHQYCADNVVTAYDGEQGQQQYGEDEYPALGICNGQQENLYGFAQDQNYTPFSVNGWYVGADGDGQGHPGVDFLEYDGHPGFDFVTKDQGSGDGKIPVLAAADGTVVCSHVPKTCTDKTTTSLCGEGPGEIKIKHPSGYFSIYLHLSSRIVTAGQSVSSGQQIGVSGATGTPQCASPHLHFEIRKGKGNCGAETKCTCSKSQTASDSNNCIPVDPYGWTGSSADPYTRATNINLWK